MVSWDLLLDGRRRHDIRLTLILDPDLALLCWAHYAPPLNDTFRVSYRQFLHWNDELPFVKFAPRRRRATGAGERGARRDARSRHPGPRAQPPAGVCDLLLDESLRWLFPGAKEAPVPARHRAATRGCWTATRSPWASCRSAAASGSAGAS